MTQNTTRSCGGCTACCFTHSVNMDGVQTRLFDTCSHCVSGKGCAIYDKRPYSCSIYRCLWLTGLPEAMRPDKYGVVLDVWTVPNETMRFLNLWEVISGRLNEPDVTSFMDGILATGTYVLLCRRSDLEPDIRFPADIPEDEQVRLLNALQAELRVQGVFVNA